MAYPQRRFLVSIVSTFAESPDRNFHLGIVIQAFRIFLRRLQKVFGKVKFK